VVVTFERISIDPAVMAGVPCVKGTRIPISTVVGMVAEGMTEREIGTEFPQLAEDDVRDALRHASARVDEREVELRPGEMIARDGHAMELIGAFF
jgi:uncharacterized protein (DUF433 family)